MPEVTTSDDDGLPNLAAGDVRRVLDGVAKGLSLEEACQNGGLSMWRYRLLCEEVPALGKAHQCAVMASNDALDDEILKLSRESTPESLAVDRFRAAAIADVARRRDARVSRPSPLVAVQVNDNRQSATLSFGEVIRVATMRRQAVLSPSEGTSGGCLLPTLQKRTYVDVEPLKPLGDDEG